MSTVSGDSHPSVYALSYSGRVDTGGDTSVSQRTELTIDATNDLEAGDLISIGGEPYVIESHSGSAIEVYPKVSGSATSGTLYGAQGAGLEVDGSNTTGLNTGRISCMRVGVGLLSGGLYGVSVAGLTTEGAFVGVQVAKSRGDAHEGGVLTSSHIELTEWGSCRVTSANILFAMTSAAVWNPSTWVKLGPNAPSSPSHPINWSTTGDGLYVTGR